VPSLIGLQNHGTGDDVFFRNVQIKDLPTPSTPASSGLSGRSAARW
jgi:hypothetical protein